MYGIYGNYGFSDSTDAALALSDYLDILQVPRVSWLTRDAPMSGVDSAWDDRVNSGSRVDFRDWIDSKEFVVWFNVDLPNLTTARRLKKINILALNWHAIKHEDLKILPMYDVIAVPDRRVQEWLDRIKPGLPTVVIPWATSLDTHRRPRMSTHCRVLTVLDHYTARACGPMLLHAMQAAVDALPTMSLTVVSNKRLDAPSALAMGELLRNRKERVKHVVRPNRQQRRLMAEKHEWTLWPSVAESTGLIGLESLACGTPLIGFDVPLVSTVIKSKKNGWLISCDIKDGSLQAPIALPSVKPLLDTLREITVSRDLLDDLRGSPWDELELRRHNFREGWKAILRL